MNLSVVKSRFSPGLTLALAALMIVLSKLSLWYLGRGEHLESAFVRDSQKAQLVSRMRADLYAAAQSEKQAVMAETDEDSQGFAQQARNATERVEGLLREFKGLPKLSPEEGALIDRFEASFAEYRKVDEEVLALAVQNTNLKAFALSFGKAAVALDEMEQALRPLLDGPNDKTARQAQRALAEVLRIQSRHAAHIMGKTDPRMDTLDAGMAASNKAARSALATLGKDGANALAAYERYWEFNGKIVALSRQNTNVRSLALSLERKTTVLAACGEALRVLEENIQERMATKATR